MKLIIGGSGEGKTQRMVELASELTRSKTTTTIYSFEDSPVDLAGRIVKYMNDNDINGKNYVEVQYLNKMSNEELLKLIDVFEYPKVLRDMNTYAKKVSNSKLLNLL